MRISISLFVCFLLMSVTLAGQEKKNQNSKYLEVKMLNYKELEPLLNEQDDLLHVVNFWATWCAPCIKELPYFQELHERYPK